MSAATEGSGIRAISFDGGITGTGGLTQLHTVKEIIARLDYDLNECKEEKVSKPCETFDLFAGTGLGGLYVLLFTRLKMTVDEVIAFHGRLHRELFSSQSWNEKDKEACKALLDDIVLESLDAQALDENLDSPDSPKGFICVLNVSTPSTPRFLRTYRVRSNFGPRCTVGEALYTTLADRVHLPPVPIIHDDITSLFMGAGIGFNNPTALLLEEILPCFPKVNSVSGILNLGAGYMPLHSLNTTRAEADAFRNIIMDCEGVVQALQAQCNDIGKLFTRISVEHLPEDALEPSRYFQRVYAHTHEFLSQHRISGLIDDIIVILKERRHIVSPARLVNLAGKTAKAETIFTPKMETIQTPRDTEAFIRKLTTKILLPDRTVSYLGQEHSPCLAGTRAEMMAKIQDWMYDIHAPNVKVIQGFPGTGKSTFSLSLAKILAERRHLGGRFFCRRMDSVYHTPHIFWRLLAVQLVQNYPPFAEAIAAQLQYRIPDMDLMSAEEIFRFLFTPMQSITSSELFVFIVDGIDQFGGLQQQSSAREELIRSFTLWQDLPPFCRLFITTGQDAEITAAFNSDPLILDSLETDFESRGDIYHYFCHSFGTIASNFDSLPWSWPSEDDIRFLVDHTDGLLSFASDIVRRTKKWPSTLDGIIDHARSGLWDAACGLNDLFLLILNSAFPDKSMHIVVQLILEIVVNYQPVTRAYVCQLCDLDALVVEEVCGALHSVLQLTPRLCFLHSSFPRFLTSEACPKHFRCSLYIE